MPLSLRPFQAEALRALAQPAHVICVAPTGSGKSLIYERIAAQPGFHTVLVSPLTALARQQEKRLRDAGITARFGSLPPERERGSLRPEAWILSPESLLSSRARERLKSWSPSFLVMDECHCLWDWGERFRPAFREIPKFLGTLGIKRSLWLTATLPFRARKLLREQLAHPQIEIGSFDLPTRLHLSVQRAPWAFRAEAAVSWIHARSGPGLVFTQTRESAERLRSLLAALGRKVFSYHAGMSVEERRGLERRISENAVDIIVATSAFGMGMDYPHLQWVVLWQAPPSLLALAQSIGRVGRDPSTDSQALVLWDDDDFRLSEWMIQGSPDRKEAFQETVAYLRSHRCRREGIRKYFDGPSQEHCGGRCDFCSKSLGIFAI